MTLQERLRRLAEALPSDESSIVITKADLLSMLEGDGRSEPARDLSVDEVAYETGRAPSTVRGWLLSGALRGYKLNGRDWRVTRPALHEYLRRSDERVTRERVANESDISAWRRIRET